MFASKRLLNQASQITSRNGKFSTGLTGLPIHPTPLPYLVNVYSSTLSNITRIPSGAVYRQSVEALTNQRLNFVKSVSGEQGEDGGEQAVEKVESEFGLGVIEQVIKVAEDEKALVDKVTEWKSWENLRNAAEPGQWEYFEVPHEKV